MTNKAPYCAFWWPTKNVLSRRKVKVCPKGLNKSLTPDPRPLTLNVIMSKYLRVDNFLYYCREKITDVMSALQILPFLTNKANFLDDQINVSYFITTNYEQRTMNYEIKNKANSNPIQTQFKANTKPIRTQFKPKQTQSTRPNYGKQPSTPGEDTIQKPLCIFNTYCYIDDQCNPVSPPGFTNFDGWISIFNFSQ